MVTGWKRLVEELPADGQQAWVWEESRPQFGIIPAEWSEECGEFWGECGAIDEATHWYPAPPPPDASKGDQ